MRKNILTIFIICLLLVTFSINVFSNNEITNSEVTNIEDTNSLNTQTNMTLGEQQQEIENKLTESNNRLEYVQSELTASVQKIQELDDQITEYQNQYNELQNQISSLEQQMAETEHNLQNLQNEYNKKDKLLKTRIVALYEDGDSTYLDVLLDSSNLIDFLSRYYMLEQIIEFDTNLLNELENQSKEIEEQKANQEKQETDLRVAKAKAGQMQILMENNKIVQENYMSKLTEEERQLQEQIEQFKAEQAEIERQIQEAINWGSGLAIQYTGGVMIWPIGVEGTYITSPYGNRLHPIQGVYKYHDGIDIGNAGYGAPVIAAADGMVIYAGQMGGYGNCVMIYHGDGLITLYGHGQEIKTTLGTPVKQGDIIMTVGSTGNSTGPHLHFEVRKDGGVVDPIPYLNGEITNESQNNEIANTALDTDTNSVIN